MEASGRTYHVFDGVQPDPTDVVVHEAAEAYEAADADLMMGVGGGSSIDTAKAASILATNDGHILEFEEAATSRTRRHRRYSCPRRRGRAARSVTGPS
ncbi:iron-containing alcohol dehydrogenase [Haloplanus litoreus]|uniref:iron-containing alcohol dehydrogenase n=1 Tax=Haloplanus litoreus TaxID=767515 RepID=UPI003608CF77